MPRFTRTNRRPGTRRALAAACVAFALTGCAGARPTTSQTTLAPSNAEGATAVAKPATPSPAAPTTAPGASAAMASSGDPALDQMDAELTAFEKESSGLDQAAAATQEG